MKRPGYQLMVMEEGGPDRPVRAFRLPWYTMRLVITVTAAVLIALLVTTMFTLLYWRSVHRIESLSIENQQLLGSMAKVDRLEAELTRHREFTRQIADLMGISVPDFADSIRPDRLPEGVLADGYDSAATDTGSEWADVASGGTDPGVLVPNCAPDPNNRPRGKPIAGRLSRGFSPHSNNPVLRHTGIDFAAREGTAIMATADGTVAFAGKDDAFGFMIVIDHANGFGTTYGHNSVLLVTEGDAVSRGDRIAFSGNTGQSTAPHLHYEIRKDGIAIDPMGFLGE
jgi:murein DD-endopeptidase MepM/ murein hydrolase activator NlpD